MHTLFKTYDLAGLELPNRIVMAPMTRARAEHGVADALTAQYYGQRASAGLIVSEGIPVSREGTGYLFNPSLYTDEQEAGWAAVTDAVHSAGGRIFAQLWHVGRVSHTSLQDEGVVPVSPVARQAKAQAFGWTEQGEAGRVDASAPRALALEEMPRITGECVASAQRAMRAGFDGIELHAANGYLFEQFINGELNTRDDRYGGSIENRLRFLLETVDALCAAIGPARVGVRISPFGRFNDMQAFEDERETWLALADALSNRSLAYVHLSDQLSIGGQSMGGFLAEFRRAYRGTLIAAGGFDKQSAEAALQEGLLDLVAFGHPFISNPDLVARMRNDLPLAEADRNTFYGLHGARGYTDYPTYGGGA